MKRALVIALATFLVLLAVPAVTLTLAATERGSRWLLDAASAAAGDRLDYRSVAGTLLSGLRFSALEVRAGGQRVRIDDVRISWRPRALFQGQAHVQTLSLSGVSYESFEAAPRPPTSPAPREGISLPLAVRVDEVRIEDMSLRRAGGEAQRVDRIVVRSFSVDGSIVSLDLLEVRADALEVTARGRVNPAPPHVVEGELSWSLRLPDGVEARGAGSLSGDLDTISIDHRLHRPFGAQLAGTVSPLAEPPRLDLHGDWNGLRWPLTGTPEYASPSGAFHLRGHLRQLVLDLDAAVEGDTLPLRHVTLEADLNRRDGRFESALAWRADLNDGSRAAGRATLGGDARRIDIDHVLETPLRLTTRGHVALAGAAPELALNGEWQDLAWPLRGVPVLESASGSYRLAGPPDALRLRVDATGRSFAAQIPHLTVTAEGRVSATAPYPFDLRTRFEGRIAGDTPAAGEVRLKGDLDDVRIDGSLAQPVSLSTRGRVALTPSMPEIDITGEWRNLRWPLSGEAKIKSAAGKFRFQGPVDRPALEVEADADGPRLPALRSRLRADLTAQGARLKSLSVNTLGGEIRAAGELEWQPALRWTLKVSGARLKPERYFEDWPGEISFETRAVGRMDDDTLEASFEQLKLDGQLRGHPVEASGSVGVDRATLSVRELELRSGRNRLALSGEAGERLHIDFSVDAPVLSAVAPALGGSLEAQGRLEGTRTQPRLQAKASGHDLRFDAYRLARLTLNVDAGAAPGYPSRIEARAEGVHAAGGPMTVSLSGEGTPEAHRLVVELSAPAGMLEARATGRYGDGDWNGSIDAAIRSQDFGDWRTAEPVALSAGAGRVRLERVCLVQTPGRVCVAARWQAGDGAIEATGEATAVPLMLARPVLPPGLRVDGTVDAQFAAAGTLDRPEATARVLAPAGTFYYDPGPGLERAEFDYRDGRLDVAYSSARIRLTTSLEVDNAGRVQGRVETGAAEVDGARPLTGRIEAAFSDMGWVGVMAPRLVDVRGRLDAALDIGGTTARPTFSGTLEIKGGEANVPDLGLELRQVTFELRGDDSGRIALRGALRSGEGRLEIHGDAGVLPGGAWRTDLEIKGDKVEVARLPTVHAYASPDLRLKADPDATDLTGQVHIPRARVKLKELPQTAVKVSDDEIIVDAGQTQDTGTKRRGPAVRLNVNLSLGDDVSFEGFGISTRIDGSLAVSGETGRPPQAQGTLSLLKGRYEAYGQALKIQSGRLLFSGPMDNPGIDLTTVRVIDDITVGIVLSGTVKSLTSRVFSDPPMSEAEAFSYLLTGRPLASGTQTDAAMLQQAAAALGLKRAESITQQIGETLGLDEVSVGGDGMAQTSLLLGKQITPNLFIRYSLGVFEQSGKLLLDYRLTDSVSVQAESGEQQGMDVIYKIEREKLFQ